MENGYHNRSFIDLLIRDELDVEKTLLFYSGTRSGIRTHVIPKVMHLQFHQSFKVNIREGNDVDHRVNESDIRDQRIQLIR
jgi:hypothetical protein